jgi:glycosyltransferase involved in cell wall biosynthesis
MDEQDPHGKPLVSAIIIFLDEERFLPEAVASVLAQTYDAWELLLVDDGSVDASAATARQLAAASPERIRYLEHEGHENRGMSASRNLGIRHARGEYVAFLDADDVWLPHKLERQTSILRDRPDVGMVYGRTGFWYSWSGDPTDGGRDHTLPLGFRPDTVIRPPELLLLLLKNEDQLPAPSDALFRRDVLEAVGGWHDAFRGMFEDIVILTKVGLRAPIYVAGEQWIRYRQHPGSCVTRAEALGAIPAARMKVLHWMEEYLRDQAVTDNRVWRAMRRELRPHRHPRAHRILSRAQRLIWRAQGAFWWLAGRLLPAPAYDRVRGTRRSIP